MPSMKYINLGLKHIENDPWLLEFCCFFELQAEHKSLSEVNQNYPQNSFATTAAKTKNISNERTVLVELFSVSSR